MNEIGQAQAHRTSLLQTDGGKTKSNAMDIPSLTLPKGGGAIRGLDEKFAVNAVNGTVSFQLPLPVSPARGGASPALQLTYDSGAGNGPFGLGWTLSLPSIKRKTHQELPRYEDESDSDTYLFSNAEDLVPVFAKGPDGRFLEDAPGSYVIQEQDSLDGQYTIRYYRPRIEGLYARIERWTGNQSRDIKWRILTRDNVTTLLGWSADSRVSDPNDASRVYAWLPEFVFDDKGHCAHYRYKREDDAGFDAARLHNRNRRSPDGELAYANLYLEQVSYGNKTPYARFQDAYPHAADYLFRTVFDYGEYDADAPYGKIREWDYRPDAFSDYKAGFEIRTTRICRRVLLFHHFAELPGGSALVKSLDFQYDTASDAADFALLRAARSHGYIKLPDGTYTKRSLPPIEFDYRKPEWNREVRALAPEDLVHSPAGLEEPQYRFIDLFNEGLAGMLTEQGGGWYYKRNLGGGRFEQAQPVSPKPSFSGLGMQLQVMDLDADGGRQLVQLAEEPKGYFEWNGEAWQAFRPFAGIPNVDLADANVRLLDLNGDGKPELVITEDQAFTWYESAGREGFDPARRTPKPTDEEAGPAVVFSDPEMSIFLADMTGDGLTDIVRVRNGEVCYWPNLGYGRFGAKVGMDQAPVFDGPDAFHPSYVRLADIDGSGTTDVIYLGSDKLTCWMNRSGNAFSDPIEIGPVPERHDRAAVTIADLLGNGVACVVWSSPLAKHAQAPLQYIDLMDGNKPYLMQGYKNNLGKEVAFAYTPSTRYYIEDKLAGRPWVTPLHFPVYCLSRTETIDRITGSRYVRSYRYHHGYYDHAEREFRGFGMVETIDTERYEHWVKRESGEVTDQSLHQDPVVTKLWIHTGALPSGNRILEPYAHEYWHQEMNRMGFAAVHHEAPLPDAGIAAAPGLDPALADKLSFQERREAVRACKGMNLREEIFAHDAPLTDPTADEWQRQLTPYNVSMRAGTIALLQPKGQNKHAVFAFHEQQSITYHYERRPEDPRVAHTLNLKRDEYGHVLESASVVYPRIRADLSLPEETQEAQKKTQITYSLTRYTQDIDTYEAYRLRLPAETIVYELKGLDREGPVYAAADFEHALDAAVSVDVHQVDRDPVPGTPQKRLIEHTRTLYRSDNAKDALPLYRLASLALPYENYQLAYTSALLAHVFGDKAGEDVMLAGKYAWLGGDGWWIRSGTVQYVEPGEAVAAARDRFFLPIAYTDPYGAVTKVKHDDRYRLYIEQTEDALGNETKVERFNFRTLAPQRIRDMNHNLTEAIQDELGLVKATAVYGKGDEADDLVGLDEYASPEDEARIREFFTAPASDAMIAPAKQLLQRATTRFVYDVDAYRLSGKPAVAASIAREEHDRNNSDAAVQIRLEYAGGHGQTVMRKAQAEPGPAKQVTVHPDGSYEVSEVDTAAWSPPQLRWIGSGRTVYNNKGLAVKQYEPYFSVTPVYEDQKELVESGFAALQFYDAPGRPVRTAMPDGTLTRTAFDAWTQAVYDQNDTVLESAWYRDRVDRLIDPELAAAGLDPERERAAAAKAVKHAGTPSVLHLDPLGRAVLAIDHNKHPAADEDEYYLTRVELDIEGNLRRVVDARGNEVARYRYDMLGNKAWVRSPEAGQRWLLQDVLGHPLRTWDERGHEFRHEYDILHRPTVSRILGGDGSVPLDHIYERRFYGEEEPNPESRNLRGRIAKHYDTGGVIVMPEYDFRGYARSATRKLYAKYKDTVHWTDASLVADLEPDSYTFVTERDALGRITKQVAPDGSVITPAYNAAGWLAGESVVHAGSAIPETYLREIQYNEKGQRERIVYGNGAISRFHYDERTFRLRRLETRRDNGDPLQDWRYAYDPVGNITHIEDRNVPVAFFDNQKIAGVSTYTYDAVYRLVEATGREHQAPLSPGVTDNWNDSAYVKQVQPGDPMAMRNYTESYLYDAVGNIVRMRHQASGNDWTRDYRYEAANNRLASTRVGAATYLYGCHPRHGYKTAMPHLADMGWNFKEELVRTSRQRRTDGGTPETTYYQYDGQGRRIRKITENQADPGTVPSVKDERVYIAGYELYKRHSGAEAGLERTSLSLLDKQHRFVTVDAETKPNIVMGIPVGRTPPARTVRYQLHNHLGSATLELDDAARVINYEEFHPYGTTAYQADHAAIRSAAKRYRYTGMERDEESGLAYHGARYYAPWIGRWISADPIGLMDGVNVYRYVKANPIREADYNGKQSGDVNEIGMAMMWDRMGQELSAIWTGIFGGSAYISPRSNRVDISPPRGGVGGVTGGVIRAATFRAVPIEDHPTQTSLVGMEMGASLVPVADPAARLVCGTTVTGQDTSRVRAAVELTLDLAPLVAEARAATRPATIATREAAVVTREARVAEEVAAVERAAAAEATVGGRSRAPAPPDPGAPPVQRGRAGRVDPAEHSGPWVDDAADVRRGGAITQSCPGSCVSASGQMITGGKVTEAELLEELGEWSNIGDLTNALNRREAATAWRGGGFASGSDAVTAASKGPMAAELRVPGAPGHMVVIQPAGNGRFIVRDPLPGVSYTVDQAWIERYVAGGVFR